MTERATGAGEAVLVLDNVCKRYGDAERGTEVLRGVSLSLAAGASLAIVGPSGSGKSTLLHIMGSLDRPTSGTVRLKGRDLAGADDCELARIRSRDVGFVFQFHHLLPQLTVLENALLPAMVGGDRPGAGARATELLARVGLEHRLDHRPGELSGGECQRVAVVRALINRPSIVLADEPTGSLDHRGAEQLGGLLADLNREQGVTLVVVTHAADLAARMSRVLQLEDGMLRAAP